MDADATFVTRSDLKEMMQEFRFEMTHLEHRLTNKVDDVLRSFSAVFSMIQMAVCDPGLL